MTKKLTYPHKRYTYMIYNKMASYAQLGQDYAVLQYYHHKRNGFFVDIGAYDGVSLSNTYLLENRWGWTGICAEPLPNEFKHLTKVRPESICVNKAVFSIGEIEIDYAVAGMLSGIVEYLECHREIKTAPRIKVPTITLDDLLRNYNAPHFIDYLSIDTEGTELEILKSVDFKTYQFGLIHLEHNGMEPQRTEIRVYLESNGYHFRRENHWDDEYIFGRKGPIL